MNMIYRETLKNGLRIVGETMENYRSVSVGVWIGAGSVFERTPAEAGVSHFIEHMSSRERIAALRPILRKKLIPSAAI